MIKFFLSAIKQLYQAFKQGLRKMGILVLFQSGIHKWTKR